jgi:acetyl-CoA carboxylase biotin carboxylase subunit
MTSAFDTVLVANRGEIARRVLRTCREMGMRTVAVYSEADRAAPFVADADEAVLIGPAPSVESYLSIPRIIEAAERTGAGAIHPGYGFLAENADFAEACAAAGIVFVGPTPEAIRAMGSKIASKALMTAHGVPVIPGFDGGDQSDAAFVAAAPEVGYPLLVKASAGGGGKGMRVVHRADDLAAALAAGRREALGAFGDGALLLERYVDKPRHIEVQIVGDAYGDVIHCFERECTIQRRHQKILEETPSVALDGALRSAICDAAVRAGRAIGYRSAGTVEFVMGGAGDFYFLEVNTRLQVEHPVTELVTGLDLVRLQLEVALGHPLPLAQDDVTRTGHAIEARLYAEDPAADFLPQTGTLSDWHLPAMSGLRVDSGVAPGSAVSIHYDPLLAKVITWGATRDEATRRLARALSVASIQGVRTNRAFLVDVLRHPVWASGELTTHFIADHLGDWTAPAAPDEVVAAATVAATLVDVEARSVGRAVLPGLPLGFRNNPLRDPSLAWRVPGGEAPHVVAYRALGPGRYRVTFADRAEDAWIISREGVELRFELGGRLRTARVVPSEHGVDVHVAGFSLSLGRVPRFPDAEHEGEQGGCRAPMTGKVLDVLVAVGDRVDAGQPLVVLEAMKMEHTLEAPYDAEVIAVYAEPGEIVAADTELVVLSDPA